MTSKEALEVLFASYHYDGNYQEVIEAREKLEKDLAQLEKLEKKNKELLVNKNVAQGIAIKLKEENEKYKNAIEILKDYRLKIRYIESIDKAPQIIFNPQDDGVVSINQEEYELLKEVLNNENRK